MWRDGTGVGEANESGLKVTTLPQSKIWSSDTGIFPDKYEYRREKKKGDSFRSVFGH